ncbi:MAG: efflux RND transporter periplasmic adaptor subunit [Thermoanaerobaculia bacterium]
MNRKKVLVLVVLVVVAAVAVIWWLSRGDSDDGMLRASGTVEATEATLAFETGGRIEGIAVREGEQVSQGQVLARLDSAEIVARADQAAARLAAAAAQLEELRRGSRPEEIAQARAGVAEARERLADARRDREKSATLEAGGAISPEALEKARTQEGVAAARVRQAEEQLALVQQGPRAERIAGGEAVVAETEGAVAAAAAATARTALVAPHSGVVTTRHREPNEIVAPGQPVLTVMNPADRWVRIFVPENRIGAVSLGTPAEIRSDTFPDRAYRGAVVFISPEAEFTPKAVQTPEERVRLVYAVKVRIDGDAELELKPGMPADVTLTPAGDATSG